jgi:hypothetical protein
VLEDVRDRLHGMSALGHWRTFAPQKVMSALPPKADMGSALGHVCFGPIADILIGRLSPKEEPRDAGL